MMRLDGNLDLANKFCETMNNVIINYGVISVQLADAKSTPC